MQTSVKKFTPPIAWPAKTRADNRQTQQSQAPQLTAYSRSVEAIANYMPMPEKGKRDYLVIAIGT